MARAYLSLVRWMEEKGETDITRVWPSMYTLNIAKFQGGNDMLQSFLCSGLIEINKNAYIPKSVFIEHYRKFCTANGQTRQPAFTQSVWESAFTKNQLAFSKGDEIEEKRCVGSISSACGVAALSSAPSIVFSASPSSSQFRVAVPA